MVHSVIFSDSVIQILGGSLEILYNVMQRPVGHDQRAYSTGTFTLNSKVTTYSQKPVS